MAYDQNLADAYADIDRLTRERDEARQWLYNFTAKVAAIVADDRPTESPDRRDPKFLLARLESLVEDEREAREELERWKIKFSGLEGKYREDTERLTRAVESWKCEEADWKEGRGYRVIPKDVAERIARTFEQIEMGERKLAPAFADLCLEYAAILRGEKTDAE